MKITALLPMKANSDRIKQKNFRNFCGKPLFKWILDTLMSIDEIEKIVINTDAKKILYENGLVENKKILLRDRRKDICGDTVSMNKIIKDDLENLDSDLYLMTHTTNPLLSKKSIKNAINIFSSGLKSKEIDSLFSVNLVQDRFFNLDAKPLNHDLNNLIRTQDLEPWYQENSNLYLFTKESFLTNDARIGKKPYMFVTPPFESVDIDNPHDWDLAEVMVDFLRKKGALNEL